jgi:hypothetical protein
MTTKRSVKVSIELDASALSTQLRALADRIDAPVVEKLTEDEWRVGNFWLNKLLELFASEPENVVDGASLKRVFTSRFNSASDR